MDHNESTLKLSTLPRTLSFTGVSSVARIIKGAGAFLVKGLKTLFSTRRELCRHLGSAVHLGIVESTLLDRRCYEQYAHLLFRIFDYELENKSKVSQDKPTEPTYLSTESDNAAPKSPKIKF
jgi:hypothetical protein